MVIQQIISFASIWCIVLPLMVGVFFIKKLSVDSLLILGIVFLGTIPQLLRYFDEKSTLQYISYNIYTPFEFILMFFLFRKKHQNRVKYRIFLASFVAYIVSSISIVIVFDIRRRFINEWVCLNNIIYTAWILLVIIEQYQVKNEIKLTLSSPFVWYLVGMFFYAPCTTLMFSLWQYIKRHPDSKLNDLWIINNLFNINMYVLFTVGFLKDIYQSKNFSVNKAFLKSTL